LDSVEYKNQLSPVVRDAERMIYDAKAQEIDGILKIAAAAGKWVERSFFFSFTFNCTVSLEGVWTVCTCGGRFSETRTKPRRLSWRLSKRLSWRLSRRLS
jgi:hypothetical protein